METPWARTDEQLEQSFRWVQANLGNAGWTRRANPSLGSDAGRYLGAHIPGARFEELPGADHYPWVGDQRPLIHAVGRFLTAIREDEAELDRVLATILFTDIVGSTEKAAALGDLRWRELLARHDSAVRAMVSRYRGEEINTTGDGFFATFDGPARAVRCAQAIVEAVRPLGVEVRAGLHTGEISTLDGEVGGLAVHIGARVGATAAPSEVLVSHTLKDLVAGSGLTFEDRGLHQLKGVPDEWRLFAVRGR